MNEAGAFAMFTAAGALGMSLLLGPIGTAIARRLGRPGSAPLDESSEAHLHDLEQRLAEMQLTTARLMEMEERLDFAERLLGQQRELPRIEQGN